MAPMQVLRGRIQQLANTNVEFDINAPVASSNANLAAEVQEVTQTSIPQIV
jgi:FKBP-type peptidyl-prolyl cis-trans isomerase 2